MGQDMEQHILLGFEQALQLCLSNISPLPAEELALLDAVDRVLAQDLFAQVDSPSVDGSSKDGYAVISEDIENATSDNPVALALAGTLYAGGDEEVQLVRGFAARILTGAEIPPGATAVVAEEFTRVEDGKVLVMNTAEPGRNVIGRGSDIEKGARIAAKGEKISPGLLGLLAASGHSRVLVAGQPRVGLIATGDEIVAPGNPLPRGKLYASNVTTLAGWCHRYGFTTRFNVVADKVAAIRQCFADMLQDCDAVVTSGGAWSGDHDLVAKVIVEMGGEIVFHRLRIGPGKGTGLAVLAGKPVFILPGGPPSNLMGFLQIALPGLLRLAGQDSPSLPVCRARCGRDIRTRDADWVQFIFGRLDDSQPGDFPVFVPLMKTSRLRSMAEADAILAVPEGKTFIEKNVIVNAQILR